MEVKQPAKQLDLLTDLFVPEPRRRATQIPLQILRRDVYAELARRRRRAQIAARQALERAERNRES